MNCHTQKVQRLELLDSSPEQGLRFRLWMAQLHNHPSIILWVVFNEAWGQFRTAEVIIWRPFVVLQYPCWARVNAYLCFKAPNNFPPVTNESAASPNFY